MSETQIKGIWLHRRAETALDAYPSAERRKVERAIHRHAGATPDDPIRRRVQKLVGSDPDFLLRATPSVCVLFNESPDEIRVLDVVLAEKLASLRAMYQARHAVARPAARIEAGGTVRGDGEVAGTGGR